MDDVGEEGKDRGKWSTRARQSQRGTHLVCVGTERYTERSCQTEICHQHCPAFNSKSRDSPAIFKLPSLLMSKFWGLRSRCRTRCA